MDMPAFSPTQISPGSYPYFPSPGLKALAHGESGLCRGPGESLGASSKDAPELSWAQSPFPTARLKVTAQGTLD